MLCQTGNSPAAGADKEATPTWKQGSVKSPGSTASSLQELQTPEDKEVRPGCWRRGQLLDLTFVLTDAAIGIDNFISITPSMCAKL